VADNIREGASGVIQATYLPDSNRLIFRVPFALNGVIRDLPNRRWDAKAKVWAAPLLSGNLRAIRAMERSGVQFGFDAAAKAAIERLEQTLSAPMVEPFPAGYNFRDPQPMKHQRAALDRMWPRPGFGLFMDMGTGKSRVVVDLACARFLASQIEQVLIFSPLSVRANWLLQWEQWATTPYTTHLLDSSDPDSLKRWLVSVKTLPVVIAGIEGLGISVRQYNMLIDYIRRPRKRTLIIFDESSKIKTPGKNRTQRSIALANAAGGSVILNGTPIANGIEDLYSQISAVNQNIIGIDDHYAFRNRYCIMGGYDEKQIVGYRNLEELLELLAPWIYQVRKSEVLTELPPKVYERRMVMPGATQLELLTAIKRQPIKRDPQTGEIPTKNVLERMLRLQQVVGGFEARQTDVIINDKGPKIEATPIDGANPKIAELMDILEESRPQKVIVWARFIPEIQMIIGRIAEAYGGQSVVPYHGMVSEQERNTNVARFQTDPKCRFFVGNQAAGGLGIELYAATVEVYYSNSFAYIDRQQSEDRAHRKGQLNSVTIIDMVMPGTIDELIMEALEHKQSVDQFVRTALDAEKMTTGWATRLLM
jgi:SNF2 family DNA or RNA helicase